MNGIQRRTRCAGFTLAEVMITGAVVAVLAATALPQYTQHLQRGHRAHARAALLQTAQWLERAATAQGTYPGSESIPASVLAVEGGRYTLAFKTLNDAEFTLQAWPQGPQGRDPCGAFELNQSGQRSQLATGSVAVPLSTTDCWGR